MTSNWMSLRDTKKKERKRKFVILFFSFSSFSSYLVPLFSLFVSLITFLFLFIRFLCYVINVCYLFLPCTWKKRNKQLWIWEQQVLNSRFFVQCYRGWNAENVLKRIVIGAILGRWWRVRLYRVLFSCSSPIYGLVAPHWNTFFSLSHVSF